jgi:ABC-type iron transport system FetAB permease component
MKIASTKIREVVQDSDKPTEFEQPKGVKPTSPDIPESFLVVQFWRDIFGKEVQSAATYSYLWMADQAGHVAIGIVLQFALTFVLQYIFGVRDAWASGIAFLGIAVVVAFWEFRAYTVSAKQAASVAFPLDKTLLRNNAIIATVYMILGVFIGYAFHMTGWWGALMFLVTILICVVIAPPWLRQKINWQKAALPYLSRLADLRTPVAPDQAKEIRALIDDRSLEFKPRQVIVGGPIGSGRTPMVTGLGTDLSFSGRKVRYLQFSNLLEFSETYKRGSRLPPMGSWGPKNILYWPWFEAQALIIDDISPVVATAMNQVYDEGFRKTLNDDLDCIAAELCNRLTIWVFGIDASGGGDGNGGQGLLERYAADIQAFCKSDMPPIVVRLSPSAGSVASSER